MIRTIAVCSLFLIGCSAEPESYETDSAPSVEYVDPVMEEPYYNTVQESVLFILDEECLTEIEAFQAELDHLYAIGRTSTKADPDVDINWLEFKIQQLQERC